MKGNVGYWWFTPNNQLVTLMKPVDNGFITDEGYVEYDNLDEPIMYYFNEAISKLPDSFDNSELLILKYADALLHGIVKYNLKTMSSEIIGVNQLQFTIEKCMPVVEAFNLDRYDFFLEWSSLDKTIICKL